MTKIKAFIFDMDGTLIDNMSFHRDSWLLFCRRHNISFTPEQFHTENHGTLNEMIRYFLGRDLPDERVEELGREKEKIYREIYKDHLREIEGLTGLLEKLERMGMKIAMATNGDMTNIDFVLDNLNIRRFFHVITGADEIRKGKPDTEIFELTLKKMNLGSRECIAVEDSTDGVIAARHAGLEVIGITTMHSKKELKGKGCFRVISNYKELDLGFII
ncbi:MAG: HAD family hydrolase [Bacteroides sp. SM23_62_1]|nr:MAG: HAD family hydrolase [Bacteroides sp. SM23_62_1]